MTDEQIVANLRAIRQQAAAILATTDALLAIHQPPPQEPQPKKPRWLGDGETNPTESAHA